MKAFAIFALGALASADDTTKSINGKWVEIPIDGLFQRYQIGQYTHGLGKQMTPEQKASVVAIAKKTLTHNGVEVVNPGLKERIVEDLT